METTAQKGLIVFKEKLKIAENHLENLVSSSNANLSGLPQCRQMLIGCLKESRDEIVSAIDDMIERVAVQTKQQLPVLEAEVAVKIDKMKEIEVSCQNFKETIDVVSEYGLPVHKVLTQASISKGYYKIEKDISMKENEMELLDFDFDGKDRLQLLYSELKKCQEEQVKVVRKPCDFLRYEDQVNQTRNKNVVKTEEIFIDSVSNCFSTYTGITVINDKQLLLCDNCQRISCGHVCLYDIKSKSTMKLKMNKPFSAAVLKYSPSHVAVSVPRDKQIHIVSIKGDKLKVEKTFTCDKPPYSLISLDNGLIGVTWDCPPSFEILDMSGSENKTVKTFTQDTTGRKFKTFKYVAVDKLRSHIVQPCTTDQTVYCFDFSGNPVFEYKDIELQSPCGVDIDRDGNIYICSQSTKTLHVLTPLGRKIRIVKDMPYLSHNPQAIRFDETGNRLWLTSRRELLLPLHHVLRSFNCRDKIFLLSLIE